MSIRPEVRGSSVPALQDSWLLLWLLSFGIVYQYIALCFSTVTYPPGSPELQWSFRGLRPRDSTSRVPVRCGPCLLGGPWAYMCSGSALALSLPRDHAKEGVVRSHTLGACNLSRCLLRYRTRQNVPPLVRGVLFLSVTKGFIASSPCLAPLGGCSLLLPSLESLVSPSRFHVPPMRSTC